MTVYTLFSYIALFAACASALTYWLRNKKQPAVYFVQFFLAGLFLFSGFVKAVDPVGTSIKMHEYFGAFAQEGMRPLWEWMGTLTLPMAVIMIVLELALGISLLVGWRPRLTLSLVLWLNLFFLFLTGYTYLSGYGITHTFLLLAFLMLVLLAITPLISNPISRRWAMLSGLLSAFILAGLCLFSKGFFTTAFIETQMKVTDCGCFGDFMKLKPWETFYKDVFLTLLTLGLVLVPERMTSIGSSLFRLFGVLLATILSTLFCLYNFLWNEPVMDFRPYAPGKNIPEQMQVKRPPVIEMKFLYKNKKTGEVKAYSTAELSGLNFDEQEFVERKDEVKDPGIPAVISNLLIEDEEGNNRTEELVAAQGYSLMLILHNLKKTDTKALTQRLNPLAKACGDLKIPFFAVCVNDGSVENFRHSNQCAFPFYFADETPLKTMVRSNPGLLLLHNGIVVAKWHKNHIPDMKQLQSQFIR